MQDRVLLINCYFCLDLPSYLWPQEEFWLYCDNYWGIPIHLYLNGNCLLLSPWEVFNMSSYVHQGSRGQLNRIWSCFTFNCFSCILWLLVLKCRIDFDWHCKLQVNRFWCYYHTQFLFWNWTYYYCVDVSSSKKISCVFQEFYWIMVMDSLSWVKLENSPFLLVLLDDFCPLDSWALHPCCS